MHKYQPVSNQAITMQANYIRVLPRDLLTESILLRCVGRLVHLIEFGNILWLACEYDGRPFDIQMNPADGSISVDNIHIYAKNDLQNKLHFSMHGNSRDSWPLWLTNSKSRCHKVFDECGNFILQECDL